MATKLCSKHETTAADQHIIANGSKLLIIKKRTGWTDKELIVTPCEENFSSAVVYGYSSTFGSAASDAKADGDTVNNRIKQIFSAKTESGWQTGYKPLLSYTARGGCPYMIRAESSLYEDNRFYLEQGSVRRALRFNTYAIPPGNCDSFKAYIRFWNPSMLQGISSGNITSAFNYAHNKSGYVSYHFDDELCAPNQFEATGYGTAKFLMDTWESGVTCIANQNYGTSGGMPVYDPTEYDPWNTRAVRSGTPGYGDTRVRVFKKGDSSTDPYYHDHEITGTALELLKNCLSRKSFWMHVGFRQGNMVYPDVAGAQATGMIPGSTLSGYCSRIELRLVLSWKAMNI